MALLAASNLKKSYKERTIIQDVSLSMQSGEIVGLLGPNGAGKTTCFYMIAGLVSPDQGKVTLGEKVITHLPIHRRSRLGLGYLPQEPSIFRKLTVAENILSILETRKHLSTAQCQEKLAELLNDFRIEHISDSLGISLSGGERRRVEIARALASDPMFILLDEPFAGVDPISVEDLKVVIQGLANRGIGILITDHNVRETLNICEKAYIVSDGLIAAEGKPDDILSSNVVREVYLGESFQL